VTCSHAHLDASYVLGALAPSERAAFEEHLSGCEVCSRSVQRLAGLPGLLTRVPADTLDHPSEAPPMPPMLPALVRSVRRHRRRRDAVTAVLAAAVTALLVGVGVTLLDRGDEPAGPAAPAAQLLGSPRLAPDHEALTDASLALAQVLWGTRLDLTCTYSQEYRIPADGSYSLVVRTAGGEVEQVGTWRALPGRTMTITAATSAAAEDIAAVEVQTASGSLVARWRS
jgi:hypothetical protein